MRHQTFSENREYDEQNNVGKEQSSEKLNHYVPQLEDGTSNHSKVIKLHRNATNGSNDFMEFVATITSVHEGGSQGET